MVAELGALDRADQVVVGVSVLGREGSRVVGGGRIGGDRHAQPAGAPR